MDDRPARRAPRSGTTTALQPYALTPTQARYVRVLGYGNTQNLWNSVTEVKIYGQ